jgi:predicted small integral membrane protein
MEQFAWMAWTWPTAAFFAGIACLLCIMTLFAVFRPEIPRVGVLGVATTRGDRLFLSLIGSAFIHLAWLGLAGPNLWWASAVSLLYAFVVFSKV